MGQGFLYFVLISTMSGNSDKYHKSSDVLAVFFLYFAFLIIKHIKGLFALNYIRYWLGKDIETNNQLDVDISVSSN